jgi:hypothetical protein
MRDVHRVTRGSETREYAWQDQDHAAGTLPITSHSDEDKRHCNLSPTKGLRESYLDGGVHLCTTEAIPTTASSVRQPVGEVLVLQQEPKQIVAKSDMPQPAVSF